MQEQAPDIPVKYIFRRPRWVDLTYGTGLEFVTGQTRVLPNDLALKFLRHTDTFVIDKEHGGKRGKTPTEQQAELLAAAAAKAKADESQSLETFELYDQIDRMGKETLTQFTNDKFNVPLDKKRSIADLRVEVKALVDRFGVTA